MPRPAHPPLGLHLASVARTVGRAFDDALAAAGGSVPVWQILLTVKADPSANQRGIAAAVGIRGATLTHHLNAMENDGLLTRRRDPANRRVHVVELTDRGEALFHALRAAAVRFDRRLRDVLSDTDTAQLVETLNRLRANVSDQPETEFPHPV